MYVTRQRVRWLIVLAFVVRGAFLCLEQPMWEGFDEWAHFGYIQQLAEHGRLPRRTEQVSEEVRRSLELVPLSAAAAEGAPGSLDYDKFWRLPPEERSNRERELLKLRPDYRSDALAVHTAMQYETQQAPLYYATMAPVYLATRSLSLPSQVFALRFASLLIAAVGIWLGSLLAEEVRGARPAAIAVMALLAAWPGLLLDVSRIGNDGLAMTMGAAFLLLLCRREWILAGAALGAALGATLLSKGYMLALVPLLPIAALLQRRGFLRTVWRPMAIAVLTGGWWYAGEWLSTGTLTGDMLSIGASHAGIAGQLGAVASIHWFRFLDGIATTYIWTGGWSFLAARSWMYRVFEIPAVCAVPGLITLAVRRFRKREGPDNALLLVGAACSLFLAGLAYFALAVYLTTGKFGVPGWYMNAVDGPLAVVLAAGFTGLVGARRGAACVAGMVALSCVFDLYTVHFLLLPWHAGLTTHLPNGFVTAFHAGSLRDIGITGVLDRLSIDKPAGSGTALAALWIGYLAATIGLFAFAVAACCKRSLPGGSSASRTRSLS